MFTTCYIRWLALFFWLQRSFMSGWSFFPYVFSYSSRFAQKKKKRKLSCGKTYFLFYIIEDFYDFSLHLIMWIFYTNCLVSSIQFSCTNHEKKLGLFWIWLQVQDPAFHLFIIWYFFIFAHLCITNFYLLAVLSHKKGRWSLFFKKTHSVNTKNFEVHLCFNNIFV